MIVSTSAQDSYRAQWTPSMKASVRKAATAILPVFMCALALAGDADPSGSAVASEPKIRAVFDADERASKSAEANARRKAQALAQRRASQERQAESAADRLKKERAMQEQIKKTATLRQQHETPAPPGSPAARSDGAASEGR